jgi:hypothetical protein
MLLKLGRQAEPFYLWHQPPNVMRASSSRRRFVSAGSLDF